MKTVLQKSWIAFESQRLGLTPQAVFARMVRGFYPNLRRRWINQRVVKVYVPDDLAKVIEPPRAEAVARTAQAKRNLAVARGQTCDCGRPAIKNKSSFNICSRCAEIEKRLEDYHKTKNLNLGVCGRGLTEHVLHLERSWA
jgi:hypothetical protein